MAFEVFHSLNSKADHPLNLGSTPLIHGDKGAIRVLSLSLLAFDLRFQLNNNND